jgi:hypothetical protein
VAGDAIITASAFNFSADKIEGQMTIKNLCNPGEIALIPGDLRVDGTIQAQFLPPLSIFGEGAEDCTISEDTAITTDQSYHNLTIAAGKILTIGGLLTLRVNGTLTIEDGAKIQSLGQDGGNAVGATGGTGLYPGATGTTGVGVQGASPIPSANLVTVGEDSGFGGAGGAGGAGEGAAQRWHLSRAHYGPWNKSPIAQLSFIRPIYGRGQFGPPGGSGAGDGVELGGGGGGGGTPAYPILIFARHVVFASATSLITTIAGKGGNGAPGTGGDTGGGGGGAGAGGSSIFLAYYDVTLPAGHTEDEIQGNGIFLVAIGADGGTGGAGTGTGAAGENGTDGSSCTEVAFNLTTGVVRQEDLS